MDVSLPVRLGSTFDGFSFLVDMYGRVVASGKSLVHVDISSLEILHLGLCPSIGVLLYRLRENKISIRTHGIARAGLENADAVRLPYRRYGIAESKRFINGYVRQFVNMKYMPQMTSGVCTKMLESLGELFNNAKTHSASRGGVFVCGEYNPSTHGLTFAIADAGVGFRRRLLDGRGLDLSAIDAILWALSPMHTAKTGRIAGGLGLKILKDFIRLNGGRMTIASDRGYWEMSRNGENTHRFSHAFPGTAIVLEVNAADEQFYRLKNEATV